MKLKVIKYVKQSTFPGDSADRITPLDSNEYLISLNPVDCSHETSDILHRG